MTYPPGPPWGPPTQGPPPPHGSQGPPWRAPQPHPPPWGGPQPGWQRPLPGWRPPPQQPGQQWGPPPSPPTGRPPRRPQAGLIATLTALLVAALVAAVVIVINRNSSSTADHDVDPRPPAAATTREQTTDTRAPASPTTRRTTTSTTAQRTAAPPRTTAPRTTATRPTTPRTTAPRPTTPRASTPPRTTAPAGANPTGPRRVFRLADNPLLTNPVVGLKNRVCNLPAWQSTQGGIERFFRAQTACLDAAWRPLLEYYNMPFTSPKLVFPTGSSINTPCGNRKVGIKIAALYCRGALYIPLRGLQTDVYGNAAGVYMAVFAHEYGHHVQEQSGLLDATYEKIRAAGATSPKGLEMSRRMELQAQCFSGMFLGAHVERGGTITQAMFDEAWLDQETRGDETSGTHDHGTNAHYASWWRQGATKNRTAQCNTYAAAAASVS